MPIYDYVCSNCATRAEFIHGIDAPAPRLCPTCGADGTLKKAFAPPAVHFKGSGWAKKDRSSSAGSKTKAAGADGGGSDGGTKAGKDGGGGPSDSKADGGTGGTPTKEASSTASSSAGGDA